MASRPDEDEDEDEAFGDRREEWLLGVPKQMGHEMAA